jgi:Na+/H+ antiporter NhaA
MLSTIARRAMIPVLAAVIGLAVPAAVIDPLPIGPNEVFAGFVNDHQTDATVVADCVGVARSPTARSAAVSITIISLGA